MATLQHLSTPPFLQLHSGHMLWHWLARISLALPARKRCWIDHAVQSFRVRHGLIAWFKFIIPYSVFLSCGLLAHSKVFEPFSSLSAFVGHFGFTAPEFLWSLIQCLGEFHIRPIFVDKILSKHSCLEHSEHSERTGLLKVLKYKQWFWANCKDCDALP